MAESQEPTAEEVDALIAEFDGDMREAIRALMHDLAVLAADVSSVVSRAMCGARWMSDRPATADSDWAEVTRGRKVIEAEVDARVQPRSLC